MRSPSRTSCPVSSETQLVRWGCASGCACGCARELEIVLRVGGHSAWERYSGATQSVRVLGIYFAYVRQGIYFAYVRGIYCHAHAGIIFCMSRRHCVDGAHAVASMNLLFGFKPKGGKSKRSGGADGDGEDEGDEESAEAQREEEARQQSVKANERVMQAGSASALSTTGVALRASCRALTELRPLARCLSVLRLLLLSIDVLLALR